MDKHFQELDKQSFNHQDWTHVVTKSNVSKQPSINKLSQAQQKDIKLLKQVENDELKHKKVTPELRTKIQQKRTTLKLKQKDLAKSCNLPVSIINDIETGKATYNHQHINKIKKILNI